MLFKILIALTMIPILGSSSHANWGSGLSQANPGCGVDNQIGDEAMGIKEELKEKELELKELKSDQRRIKSRTGSLRSSESSARESFKSSGFGDAAFNELETHVNSGASCSDYQGYCDYRGSAVSENETEAYPYWYVVWNFNPGQDGAEDIDAISSKRQPAADLGGQTPPVDDDGEPPPKPNPPRQEPPRPNPPVATEPPPPDYQRPPQEQPRNYPPRRPYSPPLVRACRDGSKSLSGFEPSSFLAHCGPGRGEVRDSICSKGVANEGMYAQNFNPSNCRKNLRNWLDKRKELRSLETELEDLDAKIRQLTEELRLGKKEYREAVKEHQRDLKDGTTEAGCVACDIRGAGGNGGGRQNSIWDTISSFGLAAASIYSSYNQGKYITDQNAKLGFQSNQMPMIGHVLTAGYPYISQGIYGALGGGVGRGGFACGGSAYGSGQLGPLGAGGQFGLGANGGAYLGGQNGALNGFPQGYYQTPQGGGLNIPGYGFGNQNTCPVWPCPAGFNMNAQAGFGGQQGFNGSYNPFAPGQGNNLGFSAGAQFGNPNYGNFNGAGGAGGAFPLNGGYNNGFGVNAGLNGNVGYNPYGLNSGANYQLQQQQMQMQYQYAQQQAQAMQAEMARAQALQGLYGELDNLTRRIQTTQVQYQSGGALGFTNSFAPSGYNMNGGYQFNAGVNAGYNTGVGNTLYQPLNSQIPQFR